MSTKSKLAFGCYLMAIVIIALFGMVYMFKGSFMLYHAEATGMQWSEVPENFQILIVAFMKAFGGSCLVLSFGVFIILIKEFPKGSGWAMWCIPLLLSLAGLGGLYAISHVMLNTQASPPWGSSTMIVLLSIIGFVLSKSSKQVSK